MPRPKRIYAVATGAAQANLPPIFSIASPGDTVVWLETPLAKNARFADTSIAVLEQHRRISSARIEVSEADTLRPDRLTEILRHDLQSRDADPVFIATGGPKYLAFAIDRAALALGFPILYSDVAPAGLLTLDTPSGVFSPAPLRNPIALHEWLAVNELTLCATYPAPIRIWPNPDPDPAPDLVFSSDLQCQRAFFAIHQARAAAAARSQLPEKFGIPDQLAATPAFRAQWTKLIQEILGSTAVKYTDVAQPFFQRLRKFFIGYAAKAPKLLQPPLDLNAESVDRLKAAGWLHPDFNPATPGEREPGGIAGDRFELAVANRVARFLNANSHIAAIVSGVYLKVSIAASNQPALRFAEFDVAILLHNAGLIHIECKCGREPGDEDAYARLGKLQSAGKAAATLVFCIPMFPALAADPVFPYLANLHKRISDLRKVNRNLGLLFFTDPAQPATAPCQYAGESFTVVPFERELEKLLARYVPPAHSVAAK